MDTDDTGAGKRHWYDDLEFVTDFVTHMISLCALLFVMQFFKPDNASVQEYAYYSTIEGAQKMDTGEVRDDDDDLEIGAVDEDEFTLANSKHVTEQDLVEMTTKVGAATE